MEIKRDRYLKKIISFMWDGKANVITGIRRCGKSYLLRTLFRNYLLSEGVAEDHILSFELDLTKDIRYRNPLELAAFVRGFVESSKDQYKAKAQRRRCRTEKCPYWFSSTGNDTYHGEHYLQ